MSEPDFVVRRGGRSRKLWRSALTGRFMWHLPRIRQLLSIATCALLGHNWSRWRIETEEWFEYVDAPAPWTWRICQRCRVTEHCAPRKNG